MIRIYVANDSNVLTDISAYVNLQTPGVISVTENAEEQSVATSSLEIEDPLGALNLVGLRDVVIDDDLASFHRIWRGQMWIRHVKRGDFRAGAAARIWTAELNDLNTRLNWRVGEGNVNRPAETDVERMQYLITQLVVTDIVQDTSTYFSTANPVAMDAADYNGQQISDYVNDCLQAATAYSKNCYLLNVAGGSSGYQIAMWYGPSTLTTFTATTKISNVLSDVDNSTVFAPFLDAELARDPSRVFSGLHVNYDGGYVYRTRGATASVFFATRDTVYDAVNVKTSTKASARGDAQLTTMSTEDDIITCTILVSSAHVNDIRGGMRVQAKFSHFAFTSGLSYDSYTWFRVLNRTITLVSPPDATGSSIWTVALTLTPQSDIPVPPAITCATAITGITATLYDTGNIANGAAGVPPITVPNGLVPASGSQAYMALEMWWGSRTDTSAIASGGTSGITGYTNMGTAAGPLVGTDAAALGVFGYQAVAAGFTPGGMVVDFTPSWTGGFTGGGFMRALAVLVPTASTTPLQVSAVSTGSSIVFPSPVSAGSLVVVAFFHEQDFIGTPAGWTAFADVQVPNPSPTELALFGKCMAGSEGTTLAMLNPSRAHWYVGVEVPLT